MNTLRQFVEQNVRWFKGHAPETEASLDAAQQSLGVQIPPDIRWLLRNYGYWHATGISSLDDTITDTIAAREHLGLPTNLIVLYDHQDGGAILADTRIDQVTGQYRVYNVGWESVPDQIESEIMYDSYLDYVRDVLYQQRSTIAENDIDYDPSVYRNT